MIYIQVIDMIPWANFSVWGNLLCVSRLNSYKLSSFFHLRVISWKRLKKLLNDLRYLSRLDLRFLLFSRATDKKNIGEGYIIAATLCYVHQQHFCIFFEKLQLSSVGLIHSLITKFWLWNTNECPFSPSTGLGCG